MCVFFACDLRFLLKLDTLGITSDRVKLSSRLWGEGTKLMSLIGDTGLVESFFLWPMELQLSRLIEIQNKSA